MTLNLDNYTFGVEVELTGISRATAAKLVAKTLKSSTKRIINNPKDEHYEIIDSQQRTWTVMIDTSIDAQRKKDGEIVSAKPSYMVELITPVLRYSADMPVLQEIVRTLRRNGGFVNSSTGLHVHVGAERFDCRTLRNLVNIVYAKQDLLYKALNVYANRAMFHCSPVEDRLVTNLNAKIPNNLEEFKRIYYSALRVSSDTSCEKNSPARYYAVNIHSFFYRKTIEFRIFNSTLHAGWLRAYVILSIAMVNQALSQQRASSKPLVTDNERYSFRTWLLSMGFIGDEFKTPRKLLLFNLSGDSAWRYEQVGKPYLYLTDDISSDELHNEAL